MQDKNLVSYRNNYVEATSGDSDTLECVMKLWEKIMQVCKECKCTNILSISNSASPGTVREAVNYLRTFEHLEITNDYRVALVELSPVCGKSNLLVESLLLTIGINIRAFTDVRDAKRWLFFGRGE